MARTKGALNKKPAKSRRKKAEVTAAAVIDAFKPIVDEKVLEEFNHDATRISQPSESAQNDSPNVASSETPPSENDETIQKTTPPFQSPSVSADVEKPGVNIESFVQAFAGMVEMASKALAGSLAKVTGKAYFNIEEHEVALHRLAAELFVRQNQREAMNISWSTVAWLAVFSYAIPRTAAYLVDHFSEQEKPEKNQPVNQVDLFNEEDR